MQYVRSIEMWNPSSMKPGVIRHVREVVSAGNRQHRL